MIQSNIRKEGKIDSAIFFPNMKYDLGFFFSQIKAKVRFMDLQKNTTNIKM
jgi:hypothetical protein